MVQRAARRLVQPGGGRHLRARQLHCAATYAGPDTASVSGSGTCTDKAGNTSAPAAATLKYDATPPTAVAAATGAESNGWYPPPVTISSRRQPATVGGRTPARRPSAIQSGCRVGHALRRLHGQGGEHERAGFARRSSTTRRRRPRPGRSRGGGPERLVQPAGRLERQRHRRQSGVDVVQRARPTPGRTGLATVSGTCTDRAGNTMRRVSATLDVRRDGADRSRRRERGRRMRPGGTTRRSRSRSRRCRGRVRPGHVLRRRRATPGRTMQRAPLGHVHRTRREHEHAGALTFNTTRRRPSATGGSSGYRMRTAGTTTRSRSASPAPTPLRGSPPAPARPTRVPTARHRRSRLVHGSGGNTNSNVSATFKYDATRPTASGSLARAPDVERLVQPTRSPST